MAANEKAKAGGLTLRHKIGYACGDLGGCMTFALMGSIVTRYYTNVLQVNTTVLAILLLVWNIWDAVNDPLMGILMDKVYAKSHNPHGKFRPWLLRISPLLAISAVVFWTVPTFFQGTAMLVVLFFCKILYEGCYTMFNIPMGSLLGAMANNDAERSALSSARGFGSIVGNIIPMIILPQLLKKYGDTSTAFGLGAVICAGIGFVFCLLHYFWTEERNLAAVEAVSGNDQIKMRDILNLFAKNRAFVALIIHGICICTMQYISNTLGTYMYADVLGDIGLMSMQSIISMAFSVPILLLCPVISKKIGLEKLVRVALVLGAVLYAVLFFAMISVSVPAVVFMIWSTVAMSLASISIFMQWGLVAEVTDYNDLVTGKRTEGTIYGTFNLSRRIGQTIGNSVAVLALGAIGYQAEAAAQSAGTIFGIKFLCIMIPAIFIMGSWAAFRFVWNITPETRKQMAEKKAAMTNAGGTSGDSESKEQ